LRHGALLRGEAVAVDPEIPGARGLEAQKDFSLCALDSFDGRAVLFGQIEQPVEGRVDLLSRNGGGLPGSSASQLLLCSAGAGVPGEVGPALVVSGDRSVSGAPPRTRPRRRTVGAVPPCPPSGLRRAAWLRDRAAEASVPWIRTYCLDRAAAVETAVLGDLPLFRGR
jgi:hypothetical protein